VGAGTEADCRTARDSNVEPGASVVLAVRAGAAGAVVLAVGASAVADCRATGQTDIVTGTGIVFAVAIGRSSIGVVTTKERNAVLGCSVSLPVWCKGDLCGSELTS
jgi:hypothetical protein